MRTGLKAEHQNGIGITATTLVALKNNSISIALNAAQSLMMMMMMMMVMMVMVI